MPATTDRRRTASAKETEALGAELAQRLRPGDVVAISGELGAGKTTLVRGALRALGHAGRVTSPTFTLAARYEDARIPVSHLDLYRLGDAGLRGEDPGVLADEIGPDRVAFVEWAEAAMADLGSVAFTVVLRHAGGDFRDVEIS